MIRVTAIVEGSGDVTAVPTLVAKTGNLFSMPLIASNPIKAGEWKKLRRQGELERTLSLAATRNDDLILVIVDLDDGCAVEERKDAERRILGWLDGRLIKVAVVFLVREYESLFLQQPSCLGEYDKALVPASPASVRGAKERIRSMIGRRYKETVDQLRYTQSLNLAELYVRDRSYRCLCKALTGADYPAMQLFFP